MKRLAVIDIKVLQDISDLMEAASTLQETPEKVNEFMSVSRCIKQLYTGEKSFASQDQLKDLLEKAFEAGKNSEKNKSSMSAFYSGYHGEGYDFQQWYEQVMKGGNRYTGMNDPDMENRGEEDGWG